MVSIFVPASFKYELREKDTNEKSVEIKQHAFIFPAIQAQPLIIRRY